MKIIEADLKDLISAAELFNEYRVFYKKDSDPGGAEEFLSARIKNNESVIYLALNSEGKATGFVQLYPLFSSTNMRRLWLLNDLYVNKDFRKQGIAEALIERAKKLARDTDARGLILETANDNTEAKNLYFKTSWVKDDEHSYFSWDND